MRNAHQFLSLAVENTADTMNFLVPWINTILSCHSRARERETERKTENRDRDREENPMYRKPNRKYSLLPGEQLKPLLTMNHIKICI